MIACIVVTYNPPHPPHRLLRAVERHCPLVLVDNSTDVAAQQALSAWAREAGALHVRMHGNAGIAAAQNAGVDVARRAGATAVVFFDQDSVVDDRAMSALAAAITTRGGHVFALLPGDHPAVQEQPLRELMSSGSGCALDVFDRVGGFEAALFIDCVDFEWGWRCLRQGIALTGLRAGHFEHTLGKRQVCAFGLRAHLDSPERGYYQYRNITAMLLRSYVPLAWKFGQMLRSTAKLAILATAPSQRLRRLRLAVRGVRDGLTGRLGQLKP